MHFWKENKSSTKKKVKRRIFDAIIFRIPTCTPGWRLPNWNLENFSFQVFVLFLLDTFPSFHENINIPQWVAEGTLLMEEQKKKNLLLSKEVRVVLKAAVSFVHQSLCNQYVHNANAHTHRSKKNPPVFLEKPTWKTCCLRTKTALTPRRSS